MNWGKGIVIGLIAFMMFILAMGVRMMSNQTDDYDHDYYEKGLTFDVDYKKETQVVADNARPQIEITADSLKAIFKNVSTGIIHFARPSDRRMDRTLHFETDKDGKFASKFNLPTKGRWNLVFEWQSNKKSYLYQQEVTIP